MSIIRGLKIYLVAFQLPCFIQKPFHDGATYALPTELVAHIDIHQECAAPRRVVGRRQLLRKTDRPAPGICAIHLRYDCDMPPFGDVPLIILAVGHEQPLRRLDTEHILDHLPAPVHQRRYRRHLPYNRFHSSVHFRIVYIERLDCLQRKIRLCSLKIVKAR